MTYPKDSRSSPRVSGTVSVVALACKFVKGWVSKKSKKSRGLVMAGTSSSGNRYHKHGRGGYDPMTASRYGSMLLLDIYGCWSFRQV